MMITTVAMSVIVVIIVRDVVMIMKVRIHYILYTYEDGNYVLFLS